MISGIGIENFKAFKDENFLEFKKMNIFLGPNSSGKSSFIKALLLMNDTIKSKEDEPALYFNEEIGDFKSIVYGGNTKEYVKFTIAIDPLKDVDVNHVSDENRILFILTSMGTKNLKNILMQDVIEYTNKKMLEYGENPLVSVCFRIKQTEKRPNVVHNFIMTFKNGEEYTIEMNRNSYYLKNSNRQFSQPNLIEPYKFLFKVNQEKFHISDKDELEEILLVSIALTHFEYQLEQYFKSFSRIEPFRYRPSRSEYIANFKFNTVGSDGRNALSAIIGMNSEETNKNMNSLKENVNYWLNEFDLAQSIDAEELGKSHYSLVIQNKYTGIKSNIVDVGAGTSQLLPIILESFLAPKKGVLVIEEPETHIHPNAQAKLASMFTQCIRNDEKTFFIETHSMYFLQKIQILIAENKLKSDEVGIYYFKQDENGTNVQELALTNTGQFATTFPKGFFDVAYELSKRFMDAMVEENE